MKDEKEMIEFRNKILKYHNQINASLTLNRELSEELLCDVRSAALSILKECDVLGTLNK